MKTPLLAAFLCLAAASARSEGAVERIIEFSGLPGFDKSAEGHARVIETGPSNVNAVAVTLDDGPSAFTAGALNALARHGAHSTFFMIGENVGPHQEAARAVAGGGHEIGNHSFTHPNFCSGEMTRNPNRKRVFEDELQKAARAISGATGVVPKLMRMPYGCNAKWAEEAAEAMGYDVVFWSVDCRDWSRPGTGTISRISVSEAKPGSIILLHDGGGDRSQTVEALEAILSGLAAKGLKVVTVSALIDANPHIRALLKERPDEAANVD